LIKANADILFEVSWEVCNKVGGIYTVVKSKVALMQKYYKNYFLIGPYIEQKAKADFEALPLTKKLEPIFNQLEQEGITFHYGKWALEEEPKVILIDFSKLVEQKDEIKKDLWNNYKIDSLTAQWDFDESIIWCKAVARFLEEFSKNNKKKIAAHFHEWMAGSALLHLKKANAKIATVFTTHATMLGRAIAGSGQDLYSMLDTMNPEEQAYKSGVQDKFTTERACAQNTNIFTTVSEITGLEAEKILGRKPEVLVLNGLDTSQFPTVEEFSVKHVTTREKIREFITYHFFPYYSFSIKHTMILFIVGRYEFKNKGIDLFIKVLGKLNQELKKEKTKRTIAAFFWIPQKTYGIKTEVMENRTFYKHIKGFVSYNEDKIISHIVYDLVSGKEISGKNIFSKDFLQTVKKDMLMFKRTGSPSLVTHNISDEHNDAILKSFREHGLNNSEEDRVKVILYPVYLDVNDGLINLSYYDTMAGCHFGIFPSYYEPWGYTPLEAAALGVPSLTTDLSGFGRFIKPNLKNSMEDGIFVLDRFQKNNKELENNFYNIIKQFVERDKHERAINKLSAKELSKLADWNILIENYIKAHNEALKRLK